MQNNDATIKPGLAAKQVVQLPYVPMEDVDIKWHFSCRPLDW